jgi:hypothetical protein
VISCEKPVEQPAKLPIPAVPSSERRALRRIFQHHFNLINTFSPAISEAWTDR